MSDDTTTSAPVAPNTDPNAPSTTGDAYTAALEQGLKSYGLSKNRLPAGTRYYGNAGGSAAKAVEMTDAAEGAQAPEAKEHSRVATLAEPPPSQSSLSAGFAKLNRQQRSLATRESAFAQRETAIKAAEAELTSRRETTEKEFTSKGAELAQLQKLLDEDDGPGFVEALAAKKGAKFEDVYNRLTKRALADYQRDPAVDKLQAELEKTRAEVAAHKAEIEKREVDAKAAADDRVKAQQAEHANEEQRNEFVRIVGTEWKEEFPLLAAEDAAEIKKVAWDLAMDHIRRTGAAPRAKDVAEHLEKQLSYAQWQESQTAGAKAPKPAADSKRTAKAAPIADTDEDADGAVNQTAKRIETPAKRAATAPSPTLTNQLAQVRSGKLQDLSKISEKDRLARALATWK